MFDQACLSSKPLNFTLALPPSPLLFITSVFSSMLSAGHVLQRWSRAQVGCGHHYQRGEVREPLGSWRPLTATQSAARTRWAGSADPTHQWTTYFSHHPVKWTSHSPSQAAQCQVDVCGFLVPRKAVKGWACPGPRLTPSGPGE